MFIQFWELSMLPIIRKTLLKTLHLFISVSDNQWGIQAGTSKSITGAYCLLSMTGNTTKTEVMKYKALFFDIIIQKALDTVSHAKLIQVKAL